MQLFSIRDPIGYVVFAPYYGECCGDIHLSVARVFAYTPEEAEHLLRDTVRAELGLNNAPTEELDEYLCFGEVAVFEEADFKDLSVIGAPVTLAALAASPARMPVTRAPAGSLAALLG